MAVLREVCTTIQKYQHTVIAAYNSSYRFHPKLVKWDNRRSFENGNESFPCCHSWFPFRPTLQQPTTSLSWISFWIIMVKHGDCTWRDPLCAQKQWHKSKDPASKTGEKTEMQTTRSCSWVLSTRLKNTLNVYTGGVVKDVTKNSPNFYTNRARGYYCNLTAGLTNRVSMSMHCVPYLFSNQIFHSFGTT